MAIKTGEERLRQALAANARGDVGETERLCGLVMQSDPRHGLARTLLGMARFQRGDPEGAIELFEAVVKDEPTNADALVWLSNVLGRVGRCDEAVAVSERLLRLHPNNPEALFNLGTAYLGAGSHEKAVDALTRAIRLRPGIPIMHFHLGNALMALGRNREAAANFLRASELAPEVAKNWIGLAQARLAEVDHEGAKTAAARAMKLEPNAPIPLALYAQVLFDDDRNDEAIELLDKALEADPTCADAHANLGYILQVTGQLERCRTHLARALELDPKLAPPYFCLSEMHRFESEDDPLLQGMETLSREPSVPLLGQCMLRYGLGKAYQDLERYETAMGHFDEGNRLNAALHQRGTKWDRAAFKESVDRTIQEYDARFLESNRAHGSPSELPVLIVGMIRSGTTLTEQILSSHRDVAGAGELHFWFDNINESLDRETGQLRTEGMRDLADRYVALLHSKGGRAARVTDKMPGNYAMMGPIHAHLPNARFIHVRRNPIDTCLSIWTTYIRNPIEYAYDRDNIVFAYQQYLRAMEHWRSVMPPDRLLEITYEDLVSDPAPVVRRMLEFCGLDWDDACLRPEENVRSVNTPSLWRVRQRIDRTAVEKWRRYEPWLGEFAALRA